MNAFSSADYWQARYCAGGTSGAGSAGRLLRFKADFINNFVRRNQVASVLDLGCGDGSLLSLLRVSDYTGVDVAPAALAHCAARFPDHRFLPFAALESAPAADLAMSIDVVFHLVEDAVFAAYMRALFGHARRFVLVYGSNVERDWPSPHVRHRRFSDHITATQPDWTLAAHVPNRYPFDPSRPDDTSFADFFVYVR
jgi:SAM-dependent methyltransferase